MGICVVSTSSQLFVSHSYTGKNCFKKQKNNWQNAVLCDSSILYSTFYLSLAFVFCIEILHFQS